MNFVRKFVNRGKKGTEEPQFSAEKTLGLQHLRKLFLEFLHPPETDGLTVEHQESRLFVMLPLFLRVFSDLDPIDMSERFGDVLQFAGHTSKLLVNYLQRLAANKDTGEASQTIMDFLVFQSQGQENRGWNLICVLNILSQGEVAIIECMVAAALPSVLVKAISIFFSLPVGYMDEEKVSDVRNKIIPTLTRLCYHPITAKELIRTDDLLTLFIALTKSCSHDHITWRSGVSEVITAITRHCLTREVIDYVAERSCIPLCLGSIRSMQSKDPMAVVEMFVTLICVLKDSAEVSSVLMDNFTVCKGYQFLTNLLIEFGSKEDEGATVAGRNLVLLISSLVLTGYNVLSPSLNLEVPFQNEDYKIPDPSGNAGVTVRNLNAFEVLLNTFLKVENEDLSLHILRAIQHIFNSDPANYFILIPHHPVTQLVEKATQKSTTVQREVFKLIEFLALQLHWVPTQELMTTGLLFKESNLRGYQSVALHTLIRLVNQDEHYKNVFRECGLLELLTNALRTYSDSLKESANDCTFVPLKFSEGEQEDRETETDYLFLLMECIRLLVESNSINADCFHQYGGSRCAHNLIPYKKARPYAIKIIQQLIIDGGHDDLGTLLGLMHSTVVTDVSLKTDVLASLIRIFAMSGNTRRVFQEVGGFVYVVSLLVSLEGSLQNPPVETWGKVPRKEILELVWSIFQVLTAAMQDEPINKTIFMDEIRFRGLTDTVKLLGCFPPNPSELPPIRRNSGNGKADGTIQRRNKSFIRLPSILDIDTPDMSHHDERFVQIIIFKCLLSMACGWFETLDMKDVRQCLCLLPANNKVPKIVYPRAVTAVFELLPLLWNPKVHDAADLQSGEEVTSDTMFYVLSELQSLVSSDQNQQLLCDSGLPQVLLVKYRAAFMDEDHLLNAPNGKLFERLATQSLTPDMLRLFLRMASPLCCKSPYALLRRMALPKEGIPVDTSGKELQDNRQSQAFKSRKMSFSYMDGDIRLSYNISSIVSTHDTSFMTEENELHSFEEDESQETKNARGSHLSTAVEVRQGREINSMSVSSSLGLSTVPEPFNEESDSVSINSALAAFGQEESKSDDMPYISAIGSNYDFETAFLDSEEASQSYDEFDDNREVCGLQTSEAGTPRSVASSTKSVEEGSRKAGRRERSSTSTFEASLSDEASVAVDRNQTDGGRSDADLNLSLNESSNCGVRVDSNATGMDYMVDINDGASDSGDELESKIQSLVSRYVSRELSRNCDKLEGFNPPQNLVKCLVSLLTPRDVLNTTSNEPPAFVEFDLCQDGYGCLYLASITPQGAQGGSGSPGSTLLAYSPTSVVAIGAAAGGASGDRSFPPQVGLTFLAWMCIEKMPSGNATDSYIRLLTVQRKWEDMVSRKPHVSTILSIYIDLVSKELLVSTEEHEDWLDKSSFKSHTMEARVDCSQYLEEGTWNHYAVTLNRNVMKSSTCTLHVNGSKVATVKVKYIQTGTPQGADLSSYRTVAFLGTHPRQCHVSELVWRLGPFHLLEDPMQEESISCIAGLGPSYLGCFQSPVMTDYMEVSREEQADDVQSALVAEDKILFALNAHNLAVTTLSKVKMQYSALEAKALADEMNLMDNDKYTPLSIIWNSALRLQGAARSIGAILLGSTGVRTFCPNSVAAAFMSVGGIPVLLSLVAMAKSLEELYASLKALSCILQSSRVTRKEMGRLRGYQILGFLLKRKKHLLNTHILHLIFSLVGTVRSDRESGCIPNLTAFQDLLCDFEIWHGAPADLERSLYLHFFELITQGGESTRNLSCLRELSVLPLLLNVLSDGKPADQTLHTIANVFSVILRKNPLTSDLLRFGQFLANTLPPSSHTEKYLVFNEAWVTVPKESMAVRHPSDITDRHAVVHMRNILLDVLHNLLHSSSEGSADTKFLELVHDALGFDWILLFFSSHIHKLTVTRAARILFAILGNQAALTHFHNGTSNGGWLEGTKVITKRRTCVAAGFNVPEPEEMSLGYEVNLDSCSFKGFPMLMTLLEEHVDVSEIYYLLFALLLGHPVAEVPPGLAVTVETLYLLFWPTSMTTAISQQQKNAPIYCFDACLVLLHLVRKIIDKKSYDEMLNAVPGVIIQFIEFLYKNVKQLNAFCTGQKFLKYLAATLFPLDVKDEGDGLEVGDDFIGSTYIRDNFDDSERKLHSHPASEHIISFMKTILVDAMQNSQAKQGNLMDTMLEAYPSTASTHLQKIYQTTVLCSVMDDIMDSNLSVAPSSGNQQNFTRYVNNLATFASKVVDKLWIGAFTKDYKVVFSFITSLINRLDSKAWGIPLNVDEFFGSLNRVVLYQLSKPQARITDQTALLEFLHLLTLNSRLIFIPANRDPVFLASVIHWLLVIRLQETPEVEDEESEADEEPEEKEPILSDVAPLDKAIVETYITDNGCRPLILAAADRVWNVFYQHKKEDIEDVFKLQTATPSFTTYEKEHLALGASRPLILDLKSAKTLLGDQVAKIWVSFISGEEKKKAEAWTPGPQATSKRISVARLSRKLKKERSSEAKVSVREALSWNTMHLAAVKALTSYYLEKHQQEALLNFQSAQKAWRAMEVELLRERGIWGPQDPSPLAKYLLDMTEGPCRMRKRLVKNDAFYLQYPYRAGASYLSNKYRLATSRDSTALFQVCQKYITDGNGVSLLEADSFSWSPKFSLLDDFESESTMEEVNSQTIVQLLEAGEKIYSMYRCARVQGLDSAEGLILFGKRRFYIIDGFTLLSTENKDKTPSREIKDIDSLPEKMHEPLIPPAKGNGTLERSCIKIDFEEISEVYKRRYILQDIAMEIFCHDGSNYLLIFPKKIARDKIYGRCQRVCATSLTNAQESVVGMKADADVEAGHGLFGSLMGERSVTQRWEKGEISNFRYLMHLNSLAGRSYNDLMQYPIFPWILADYESEELDLSNPATFRDLSLPMGAQSSARLTQFMRRYNEWEDTSGDTPAYYYGTHYSSAMIVASYLIRMEPFTQHFLRLQGGHFDLADRLFHSIKDAWMSAAETNMADVKELIPEFFYLPEFLLNSNKFDLGMKQNGDVLHDVILPTWAKNDPREFIRVHRKALESDYVSAHLHEWIDLVFGYKQSGQAAVECHNVFHHLFYEGAVDLDRIEDKTKRAATIGFIHNFGQMPRQLFKRPHPRKRISAPDVTVQTGSLPGQAAITQDKLFFHNFAGLVPSVQAVKELKAPVGEMVPTDRVLQAVEKNKALLTPAYTRYISWGFGDFSLRYCTSDDKVLSVFEDVFVGRLLCAASLANGLFVTGGTSTALCVWQIDKPKDKSYKLKLVKVLYGHSGPVTCIKSSLSYNLIVSGSEDKSVIIWDSRKLVFLRQLNKHSGPITAVAINNLTGDIVTCAGTWLYVWTVNGHPIVQENTSAAVGAQILCCTVSELNEWDEDNVILTGSADGVVRMWGLEFFDASRTSGMKKSLDVEEQQRTETSERRASMTQSDEGDGVEEGAETASNEDALVDSISITTTKTEDDYVFVQEAGTTDPKCRDWRRRLLLKHKLTMHTAYERCDNYEPAPVTALAVSKDHRKIYVGDGRGRIFCWSVTDSPGRIADHWLKDEGADRCCSCDVKFTFAERRHHCRNCGKIFCAKCSRYESPIEHLKIHKPVRVCRRCYVELKRNSVSSQKGSKSSF